MNEEARNIIKDHKNPLTKLGLIGPKLFLKDSSQEAQEKVSNNLKNLKIILMHQKVERRCGRAKAEWNPSLNLAKVNKVVKGLLEHFGYQDKSGIYMYPEEMLYLVETNRMEISLNEVPLSVQECYDIMLNLPEFTLNKYRVYKKLMSQGYRVVRFSEITRRKGKKTKENENSNEKKRGLEETENKATELKKIKIVSSNERLEFKKKEINKIFEELRKKAPQSYVPNKNEEPTPDFCLFLASNSNRINWDYNLYVSEKYALDDLKTDHPSIYAICSGDNISLYKIGTVNIPCNIYT
ncbi:unnamed protein product [Psylliodes chrysocephalus]|uniref:tRNA-splicing endonuclease subunit Sen54 N-terminal domain-containing protein n=1 Tax=Psylliodes chrysocephalus TaxID=3402493 RepID=A0A9P0CEQ1_9CUCU|nr:unnamed protein product [Psylliodes chrysocephala]